MPYISTRRTFAKQAGLLLAGAQFAPWLRVLGASDVENAIADTSAGRVRGVVVEGTRVFKGIPYGASTSGKNRFMPPVKAAAWTGTRDALAFGPTAPQGGDNSGTTAAGSPAQHSEDCLVLNVFTPGSNGGPKRPVMVWLHGGGFSSGSGSGRILDGSSLARTHDVVVVTLNHRLNVFGYTYLGDAMGSDFAHSSSVGLLDIVAALEWVRDNITNFGGDPNLVTIFGQSGGGRKVATLMAMPGAKGLFHRAVIESGAVLRLTAHEDAVKQTDLLLAELGLKRGQVRELQSVSMERLLAANAAVQKQVTLREPGMTPNTPMVDGTVIPGHPWSNRFSWIVPVTSLKYPVTCAKLCRDGLQRFFKRCPGRAAPPAIARPRTSRPRLPVLRRPTRRTGTPRAHARQNLELPQPGQTRRRRRRLLRPMPKLSQHRQPNPRRHPLGPPRIQVTAHHHRPNPRADARNPAQTHGRTI